MVQQIAIADDEVLHKIHPAILIMHRVLIQRMRRELKCSKNSCLTVSVAVFDTAFHQTLPRENYFKIPLPYEYYTKYGARKYGAQRNFTSLCR